MLPFHLQPNTNYSKSQPILQNQFACTFFTCLVVKAPLNFDTSHLNLEPAPVPLEIIYLIPVFISRYK